MANPFAAAAVAARRLRTPPLGWPPLTPRLARPPPPLRLSSDCNGTSCTPSSLLNAPAPPKPDVPMGEQERRAGAVRRGGRSPRAAVGGFARWCYSLPTPVSPSSAVVPQSASEFPHPRASTCGPSAYGRLLRTHYTLRAPCRAQRARWGRSWGAAPPGSRASSHFRVCGHSAADVPALLGALKQLGL